MQTMFFQSTCESAFIFSLNQLLLQIVSLILCIPPTPAIDTNIITDVHNVCQHFAPVVTGLQVGGNPLSPPSALPYRFELSGKTEDPGSHRNFRKSSSLTRSPQRQWISNFRLGFREELSNFFIVYCLRHFRFQKPACLMIATKRIFYG